jgi:broad specificity phosphatase PhoE
MSQKITGASPFSTEGARVTRLWWVRHAPVPDGGFIYGQRDLSCDTSDTKVFAALAEHLPRGAAWISSPLKRAQETGRAIFQAGHPDSGAAFDLMPDFAEQNLGDWQGRNRADFLSEYAQSMIRPWFGAVDTRAPNGESFLDLLARTQRGIAAVLDKYAGRDVVILSHGGVIRAAIGVALGLAPQDMLVFTTDNCSVSRLDHIAAPHEQGWRVVTINHQPWGGAKGETKLA